MNRPDWIETLRADLRPVDPDPVLLAQLTQLSARSTAPAPRPGRSVGARLAMVLGGTIAVGATSWAAGALPGTESPFGPDERITHQPTDPKPRGTRAPSPDAPASPAGEPTSPAGDGEAGPGSGTPALPGSSGPPGTSRAPGDPPLPPVDLPTTPGLPSAPGTPRPSDVPTATAPPGLGRVPGSSAPDSDSGELRSPRPQRALVRPAQ